MKEYRNMATKDFSRVQEKSVADYLGEDWSVVSGSGAAPCTPGDVIGPDWLLECKTHVTRVDSLTFNKGVWSKIKEESAIKRRFPGLVTDNGSQNLDKTWILVRDRDLPNGHDVSRFPLNVRSTTNVIVKVSDIDNQYLAAVRQIPANTPVGLKCSLDGDDCVIVKFKTFAELLGD